jgi:hypothetical protein
MINNNWRWFIVFVALMAGCTSGDSTFKLYRNLMTDQNIRLHVATFDSTDGTAYNSEKCQATQTLFQSKEG